LRIVGEPEELWEVSPSSDVMMGWGLLKLFESLLQVLSATCPLESTFVRRTLEATS